MEISTTVIDSHVNNGCAGSDHTFQELSIGAGNVLYCMKCSKVIVFNIVKE